MEKDSERLVEEAEAEDQAPGEGQAVVQEVQEAAAVVAEEVTRAEEAPNAREKSKKKSVEFEKSATGFVGYIVVISLIVSVGGVLSGCSHGFPSPTLLDLEEAYRRGDRVTAFSSSSIYAGIFGVSPTPLIIN